MFKRYRFNRICRNIKSLKIQGATNVAKAALKAYYLYPNEITKRILSNLRPTEPLLFHVLDSAGKMPKEKILSHFKEAQDKINENIFKLIKDKKIIFTHCHSTNVVRSLVYSKNKGLNFQVFNTETRPLYQGRKTAKELSKAGIKVTSFVDSAFEIAIAKQGKKDKEYVNLILLGADALLNKSVINKVGSGVIARIAFDNKIPLYIVADSWKYYPKQIKLEERDFKEVWDPKKNKIHVKNPAFESIDPRFITGIVTELGIMSYNQFLKKVN
jgi:ribose 1,5-bisphosphate isomerase